MKFDNFLKEAKKHEFWTKQKKIIFVGKDYQAVFFLEFFNYLESKKILPVNFKKILFNNLSGKNDLVHTIKQSFLGQYFFHWLGNVEKLNPDQSDLLLNYTGPNFVSFFLSDEKIISKYKKIDYIEIETQVTLENYKALNLFFEFNLSSQKKEFIEKILKQSTIGLSLDQFLLLIKYLELINIKFIDEFYDYLSSEILKVNPSLNLLSQYFWAKDKEKFFTVWSSVYKQYSDMFWIYYWSEQAWKAFYIIKYLKNNDFVSAKSLSYGLPFMFTKQYWSNYSLDKLEKDYQYFYNVDYALKTGKNFCFFDYFYLKHFSN